MSLASRSRYLLAGAALCASAGAYTAPISFNTALPVTQGQFVARAQLVVDQSGDDPSGADRDRRSTGAVAALGYGASGRLALFGVLPYLENELSLTSGAGRVTRRASGLGDLTLFARYTAYQRDRPGQTLRLAPFVGLVAPTGEDDAADAAGQLPPAVQPGAGAWGGLAGAVLTYQTLGHQLDAQLQYRAQGEAHGFQPGNQWRLDGSLQYRLWPQALGRGVPAYLYGVLEAGLVRQDEDELAGANDPDSGGTQLFLTPGLQYVTVRWIVEAAVQLPVAQDLNGAGLESDYVVSGGVRCNF